ncbi:MAG: hypothetical protein AVDCRST_MAG71-3018, partial [uncultured Lysobacter sp.]
ADPHRRSNAIATSARIAAALALHRRPTRTHARRPVRSARPRLRSTHRRRVLLGFCALAAVRCGCAGQRLARMVDAL